MRELWVVESRKPSGARLLRRPWEADLAYLWHEQDAAEQHADDIRGGACHGDGWEARVVCYTPKEPSDG